MPDPRPVPGFAADNTRVAPPPKPAPRPPRPQSTIGPATRGPRPGAITRESVERKVARGARLSPAEQRARLALTPKTPLENQPGVEARVAEILTGQRGGEVTGLLPGIGDLQAAASSDAGPALAAIGLFLPDALNPLLKRAGRGIPQAAERFAILTPENPGGRALSAAENAAARERFERELNRRGFDFERVRGAYRDDKTGEWLEESSYLIRGMPERTAEDLGRKFGQNSVITQRGLHDLGSRKIFPSRGITTNIESAFTELPSGERFALDLDFDSPIDFDAPVEFPDAQVVERKLMRGEELTPVESELVQHSGALQNLQRMQQQGLLLGDANLSPIQRVENKIKNRERLTPEEQKLVQEHQSLQNLRSYIKEQDRQRNDEIIKREQARQDAEHRARMGGDRAELEGMRTDLGEGSLTPEQARDIVRRMMAEQNPPPPTKPPAQTAAASAGDDEPERIVSAAFKHGDVIGTGFMHGDAAEDMLRKLGREIDPDSEELGFLIDDAEGAGGVSGFVTNKGRFLTRSESFHEFGIVGSEQLHPVPASRNAPVRAAALRLPDGSVVIGTSHLEAYENAVRQGKLPPSDSPDFSASMENVSDGFVDADGNFLNSAEAADRAVARGQVEPGTQHLQSEDLASAGDVRVKSAALRTRDGRLFTAPMHADAYDDLARAGYTDADVVDEGFVTTDSRFVTRKEAAREFGIVPPEEDVLPGTPEPPVRAAQEPEKVVSPAVIGPDGRPVAGTDHSDAFFNAYGVPVVEADEALVARIFDTDAEGFVTNTGRFVTREEAARMSGLRGPLRSEAMPPSAPNIIVREPARQPVRRGVFPYDAPSLQGTAQIDPRLQVPQGPRATPSLFTEALVDSPIVRQGLLADAEKGLPLGGSSWYELGPVKAFIDALPSSSGAMSFDDFVNLGGSGSIQNPVAGELVNMSVLNFALRNNLSLDDAIVEMQRATGAKVRPLVNKLQLSNAQRALRTGMQLPDPPMSEKWKVPWYSHGKHGGSLGAGVALDTHERRRLWQLAMQDPQLAQLARDTGWDELALVEAMGKEKAALAMSGQGGRNRGGILPLQNALDYDLASSLYRDIAGNLGLPSAQAAQAGRWLGGAQHTGLRSPPVGDFMELLENGLLYTAQKRGLDESPAGLQNLFTNILTGKDFFLPWQGRGAFPIIDR